MIRVMTEAPAESRPGMKDRASIKSARLVHRVDFGEPR